MALDPAGLIGARIDDRYYLLRVLGEGSFGTVYAAEERFGEAVLGAVAVKLLRPRTAAERASVVVEMGAMAQLSHPNLLSYRSSGEVTSGPSAGCLYIAMELASNSLKERLDVELLLNPQQVRELARDMALALDYLERRRAVHRDLKPANILYVDDAWKLGDFGLARTVAATQLQASATKGTVAYMAPEALRGETGPGVDVWSLGVLLQECLTGALPYSGRTEGEYIAQVISRPPRIMPDLPAPFDRIIPGCLHPSPSSRWHAKQIMDALEANAGVRAPTVRPAVIIPAHPAAAAPSDRPAPVPPAARDPDVIVCAAGTGDFTSLAEAVRGAPAGQFIHVLPGLYSESVVLEKPVEIVGIGAPGSVRIEVEGANCVRVECAGASLSGVALHERKSATGRKCYAVSVRGGTFLIDNCTITSESLACVAVQGSQTSCAIRNCQIRDGAEGGVFFLAGAGGSIEDCDISRHQRSGLQVKGGGGVVVQRGSIHHCKNQGILVAGISQLQLEDCRIEANDWSGIESADGSTAVVRGCVIRGNRQQGITARSGSLTVENSDVRGNTFGAWAVSPGVRFERRHNQDT